MKNWSQCNPHGEKKVVLTIGSKKQSTKSSGARRLGKWLIKELVKKLVIDGMPDVITNLDWEMVIEFFMDLWQ